MAEHGLAGPVIGVAYDGTGWGTDGTAWGGELLLATYAKFERVATFRPVALAGGDVAIREPWRIALALVDDAFGDEAPMLPVFAGRPLDVVRKMIRGGINSPHARGVGRFFDGLAALGLGRATATYEGQLAVAWNLAAAPGEHAPYAFAITRGEIDLRPMVRGAVADLVAHVDPAVVSARFHSTLVAATADRVHAAIAEHGHMPVVLTGGAFMNPLLSEGIRHALEGLEVHTHSEVPPGDGGIALGQALVADAIAR